MTIEELIREVVAFRDAREWARFHPPKNLAMGLGIDAGELGENDAANDHAKRVLEIAAPLGSSHPWLKEARRIVDASDA